MKAISNSIPHKKGHRDCIYVLGIYYNCMFSWPCRSLHLASANSAFVLKCDQGGSLAWNTRPIGASTRALIMHTVPSILLP